MLNVRDWGAVGDGAANDTRALQAAIDAASQAGGGEVVVPPGIYLSGMILVKSHVMLRFEPGAVLLASSNPVDYPNTFGSGDSRYREADGRPRLSLMQGLIKIQEAEDVAVIGGVLRACDTDFWWEQGNDMEDFESSETCLPWYCYRPKAWRITMLCIEDSQDVSVDGLRIENNPAYAAWILGSERVIIRDSSVCANLAGPNADGFHFSSCRWVHVTDCNFVCGDDCIAIDGNHLGASRDFIITGCIFHTTVHALRIYNGLDPGMRETGIAPSVTNVAAANCVVEDACGVLDLNAQGGVIQNISLRGFVCTLSREGTSLLISTDGGRVENIFIDGWTVRGNGCALLVGDQKDAVRNVTLTDCRFEITPKTKLSFSRWKFPDHCHFKPANFVFRKASGIHLRGVTVQWMPPAYADSWEEGRRRRLLARIGEEGLAQREPRFIPAFDVEDCEDILYQNVSAPDDMISEG